MTDVTQEELDWLQVAQAAGRLGIRYSTNQNLCAFLSEVAHHHLAATAQDAGPVAPQTDAERELTRLGKARWRERWYGSDPMKGSAIVTESGDEVACIGGDKETHKAVCRVVMAHNAGLASHPAPPAADEAMVGRVARAIAKELSDQDYGVWVPPQDWDMKWSYVDQGEVDFAGLSRAALAAIQEDRRG